MASIEILCGGNIKKAFKELDINATKTYHGKEEPHYQVWEIDKKDLHTLENTIWQDNWGWWRYAKGSNLGTACEFYTVNNQFMIGWKMRDIRDTYDTLTEYLCEEVGASTAKNVCATTVDLARANGMTVSKLFSVYEG